MDRFPPHTKKRRDGSRGQSVVEFALIAPIMIIVMFGILDLSRIYTTMMSVESSAREAADYGTALGAERWSATNVTGTIAEMNRRACIAASDLPDYVGIDTSLPPDGLDEGCSNPAFSFCVIQATGGPCAPVDAASIAAAGSGYTCDDPHRSTPCKVKVTMSHVFHLFTGFHMNFFGVQLGLPGTLSFDRDSTFAMTDIDVAP